MLEKVSGTCSTAYNPRSDMETGDHHVEHFVCDDPLPDIVNEPIASSLCNDHLPLIILQVELRCLYHMMLVVQVEVRMLYYTILLPSLNLVIICALIQVFLFLSHAALATTMTPDPVVDSMTRLLQAQTDVMAVQSKAVAIQNLPALPYFTGERSDVSGDGFDKWLERFSERAEFAGWFESEQLYHLELLLDKTALNMFRMLPDSEKSDIVLSSRPSKKRFKPGGIEELHGLEFHHKTQRNETIEQLELSIQQLGRKAFPSIIGKDFDRWLKGRFYQALLVKWQHKLGPPKADKSFHDLYVRARLLEEYERQYTASAESRNQKEYDTEIYQPQPVPCKRREATLKFYPHGDHIPQIKLRLCNP